MTSPRRDLDLRGPGKATGTAVGCSVESRGWAPKGGTPGEGLQGNEEESGTRVACTAGKSKLKREPKRS